MSARLLGSLPSMLDKKSAISTAELLGLFGILHIEGIEGAIFTDDTHIRLRLKVTHGGLDTQDVLRILRFPAMSCCSRGLHSG